MEDQQPHQTNQNKGNSSPSPIPLVEKTDNIIKDNKETASPAEACSQKKYEYPPIVINNQHGDDRQARRANNINIVIASVNFCLLVATFCIWWATRQSVNIAQDAIKSSDATNNKFLDRATQSAKAAEKAANAYLKADTLSERVFDSSTAYNERNFEFQQKGLQIQYDGDCDIVSLFHD